MIAWAAWMLPLLKPNTNCAKLTPNKRRIKTCCNSLIHYCTKRSKEFPRAYFVESTDNNTIHSVADLNGKTIVTQTNSTGITAIDANVQNAEKLLLADNDSCIAALVQGRADAYVLDQSILLSNAVRNSQVKVVGNPFTTDPYGIGLNKDEADAKAFVNAFLQTIYDSGVWLNLWKGTVGRFLETEPTPPALGSVEGS